MMISFRVPLVPVSKARARTLKNGVSYTPKKTKDYEQALRIFGSQVQGRAISALPLVLVLEFGMPIPKYILTSKSKMAQVAARTLLPAKKPDLDNLIKAVEDAFKKMFWVDDAQIVRIEAGKVYAENPYIDVTILDWGEKKPDNL